MVTVKIYYATNTAIVNNSSLSYHHITQDFWSTCAYLIDREALRPIIDNIITVYQDYTDIKIIAVSHTAVPGPLTMW